MDFHLQSSKVQATLETSHGCGMRAEAHSKSLKKKKKKKQEEDRECHRCPRSSDFLAIPPPYGNILN